MTSNRRVFSRRLLSLIAVPSMFLAAVLPAQAQSDAFPSKPVRIVYPFAPGGGMEVVLRLLAQEMQKSTGQPFIVDNRTGAGGTIAAQAMSTAAPDGYTLFVGPTGIASITPHLRKLPYETRDWVPVARLSAFKGVLVVANEVPAKTVPDFIAYAKANPGKVSYATSGVGSQGHLIGLMLEKAWGIQMTHIPYKGAADMISDLIAGRVSMSIDVTMLQYVKQGKMKLLTNFDDRRLGDFPDVPAVTELPVPPVDRGGTWFGAFAPKGTSPEVVNKLAVEFEKALKNPDAITKMRPFAMQPAFLKGRDFQKFWEDQYNLYGQVVREANVKISD